MKTVLYLSSCAVLGGAFVACAADTGGSNNNTGGGGGVIVPPAAGAAGMVSGGGAPGAAGNMATGGMAPGGAGMSGAGAPGAAGSTNPFVPVGGGAGGMPGTAGSGGAPMGGAAQGGMAQGGMAQGGETAAGGMPAVGGDPCTRSTWTAAAVPVCDGTPSCMFDATQRLAIYAIDGSTTTRFTSGQFMVGGEMFTIYFNGLVSIDGLVIDSTGSPTDAMISYELQYSTDGTTFVPFDPVVEGDGMATVTATFPATEMEAIRVIQTGEDMNADPSWWSVHEITPQNCTAVE